ncbi:MAG TPA: hypothetical protein VES67_24275 [Vicinamibacterales bacterium]|nr:hypothetical protein [Vicinamibacterales bacterium]
MADDHHGPYVFKTTAEEEAEQQAKDERRDRRQRTLQLWFNGILTAATLLTLGVLVYQNYLLKRSNQIVAESVNESKAQSKAAQAQSVAAQAQVTQTQEQTRLLREQIDQGNKDAATARENVVANLELSRQQLRTAQEQTDALVRQLGVNRPQIGVDINPYEPPIRNPASPGQSCRPSNCQSVFTIKLKNVGRSIAENVRVYAGIAFAVAFAPGGDFDPVTQLKHQETVCAARPFYGQALLEAGQENVTTIIINIPQPRPNEIFPGDGFVRPFVFGCVKYSSDIIGYAYEEGFYYSMLFTVPNNPPRRAPFPDWLSRVDWDVKISLMPEWYGNYSRQSRLTQKQQ